MINPAGARPGSQPLRGRDAERGAVEHRVDRLAAGEGGVVVVEGAPGSGKTSLLNEAAAAARDRGISVFTGSGQAASIGVPSWLLLETLTDAPVDLDNLRRVAERPEGGFWLVQEVHEGLEKAALQSPVMIVMDDFQWADLATVNAVRTLTRRLSSDPVLWVIALRPDPPAPVRSAVDQMSAQTGTVVRLDALDIHAVAQIAHDILGARPDERLGDMLAGAPGQPLQLLEFLHGLRDEQAVEVHDGIAVLRAPRIPLRFRDSIREQVRLLSNEARLAVELASVLGRTFTVEQLARMLDRPVSTLLAPLREALDADLLVESGDAFAFRHDLVREAVDSSLPGPLRRSLRRQAIDASLATGAPANEVAALVMETVSYGDRGGIALLRRAATEIGLRSPALSAQISTRAFELTRRDDPDRAALLTETVHHLVLADQAPKAFELLTQSQGPVLDRGAMAQIRRLTAEAILPFDARQAVELCREALADADLPADLRARLYAVLAGALGIIGQPDKALRAADTAVGLASDATDPLSRSAVLVAKAVADFHLCHWSSGLRAADDAIRLRNGVPDARSLSLPDAWKAMMLDATGRMTEAWRLADEGSRLAQVDGQVANMRVWSMIRARVHLRAGRLQEARAEAEAIQAMSYELGNHNYLYTAALTLALAAIHSGDQTGMAVAEATAAEMAGSEGPFWRGRGHWLWALLAEARNAPVDARAGDEDMDLLFGGCVRIVTLTEHAEVATLVRLLMRSGRHERAEAAVARLDAELHRHEGERVVAAALRHARGLLNSDPELLLEAVDLYTTDERLLLRARVVEDAGTVVVHGDRTRGLSLLNSALDQWEAIGADRDAARVRGLLRHEGVRRRAPNRPQAGWAGLTESETRVARMVAQGWTNRQIAEELFLSPHTVSSHLRHAFVKLGVRSRVELTRRMMTE
ncbi:AAA family ATPase [Micromonospora sp. NPDC048835]|uniref:ATP-binding protein n=1 Tax=Micromonospora sp. NPDC048835 TaxID=3155147 RepID=UPI00340A5EF4